MQRWSLRNDVRHVHVPDWCVLYQLTCRLSTRLSSRVCETLSWKLLYRILFCFFIQVNWFFFLSKWKEYNIDRMSQSVRWNCSKNQDSVAAEHAQLSEFIFERFPSKRPTLPGFRSLLNYASKQNLPFFDLCSKITSTP